MEGLHRKNEIYPNNCCQHPPKRRKLDFQLKNEENIKSSSPDVNKTIGSKEDLPTCTIRYNDNLELVVANDGGNISQNYVQWQLKRKFNHLSVPPNHILLFTVINPFYPITCDVFRTMCLPFAMVIRVVIFRKNGVQAMVEFQSIQEAETVKQNLHGCDIYAGCCTLKIDYSTSSKNLNVFKNDPKSSWDYSRSDLMMETNEFLPKSTRRILLDPPHEAPEDDMKHRNFSLKSMILNRNCIVKPPQFHASFLNPSPTLVQTSSAHLKSMPMTPEYQKLSINIASNRHKFVNGSICIAYGLNMEHLNCKRLFNLFCLYGNVLKIKFLKSKEGAAMVQMGDAMAIERIISVLHNLKLFKSDINITYSKQNILADVHNPYQLPDSSPSFQDFTGSKLNRFLSAKNVSKNRIQRPSNTLHYFNTPPEMTESDLKDIFRGQVDNKCNLKSIAIFSSNTNRSSSGLIEFETIEDALEALVLYNHRLITSLNSKNPFVMKLCFSSNTR